MILLNWLHFLNSGVVQSSTGVDATYHLCLRVAHIRHFVLIDLRSSCDCAAATLGARSTLEIQVIENKRTNTEQNKGILGTVTGKNAGRDGILITLGQDQLSLKVAQKKLS
jgi:hypothetical protein